MDDELVWLSAGALARGYERKDFSPVEVAAATFRRIHAIDGKLNAFRVLDEDRAMEAARASEQRWSKGAPLSAIDGVTATIKDLFAVAGHATRRGSRTSADVTDVEDAPATARLRAAGATILGKTTTPEFGWKGVTDSPLTGTTRNPWNLAKTPGGSSGGASAAAAAGMGVLNLGTDGGGSIRIPAAFAGIFGHKPSFGRVPYYPPSPMGTLAHAGPLTRTVTDALLMLNALMGEDTQDWSTLPSTPIHAASLNGGIKGLRVAWSPAMGHARVDPEVAARVEAAVAVLRDLGADVVQADPPGGDPVDIFDTLWISGAFGALRNLPPEQKAELDPGLAGVLERAARIDLGQYMDAQRARFVYASNIKQFMTNFDVLVTPSLAVPAFDVDQLVPEGWTIESPNAWVAWTPFSYPFNLTQQPACSVPCGFTADGLPVGLQIVGRMFDDATVLRTAHAFQQAMPLFDRHPDIA